MPIGYKTSLPEQYKYFILTVSSCEKGNLSGFIYHEFHSEGLRYTSTIELVRLVEDLIEKTGYPSKTTRRRSFLEPDENGQEAIMREIESRSRIRRNVMASFRIRMSYQYRSTWQGFAENRETGEKLEFESFLDLLNRVEQSLGLLEEQALTLLPRLGEDGEKKLLTLPGGTFAVKILFRRYKTLQGVLYWLDRKKQINFRSYLELLHLLEEACTAGIEAEKVVKIGDIRRSV